MLVARRLVRVSAFFWLSLQPVMHFHEENLSSPRTCGFCGLIIGVFVATRVTNPLSIFQLALGLSMAELICRIIHANNNLT